MVKTDCPHESNPILLAPDTPNSPWSLKAKGFETPDPPYEGPGACGAQLFLLNWQVVLFPQGDVEARQGRMSTSFDNVVRRRRSGKGKTSAQSLGFKAMEG